MVLHYKKPVQINITPFSFKLFKQLQQSSQHTVFKVQVLGSYCHILEVRVMFLHLNFCMLSLSYTYKKYDPTSTTAIYLLTLLSFSKRTCNFFSDLLKKCIFVKALVRYKIYIIKKFLIQECKLFNTNVWKQIWNNVFHNNYNTILAHAAVKEQVYHNHAMINHNIMRCNDKPVQQ